MRGEWFGNLAGLISQSSRFNSWPAPRNKSSRGGAAVARLAHNQEAIGSNPIPAIQMTTAVIIILGTMNVFGAAVAYLQRKQQLKGRKNLEAQLKLAEHRNELAEKRTKLSDRRSKQLDEQIEILKEIRDKL